MNDLDNLLWRALEGSLGTVKTAYLRSAPLTSLLGHDNEAEEFTLAHAAGHIAKHAAAVRKENEAIFGGLSALSSVLGLDKTAGVGGVLDGISKNEMLRSAGKSMLTGGALATGAGAPAYLYATAASDKATEQARDRALQAGAGLGAMALTGYGAKGVIDRATRPKQEQGTQYGIMPIEG
jgi:hypothetical protein